MTPGAAQAAARRAGRGAVRRAVQKEKSWPARAAACKPASRPLLPLLLRPRAPRGMQALLNQRRALLSYLRRADFPAFCFVIHRLGLRDNNYAKQARLGGRCAPRVHPSHVCRLHP